MTDRRADINYRTKQKITQLCLYLQPQNTVLGKKDLKKSFNK